MSDKSDVQQTGVEDTGFVDTYPPPRRSFGHRLVAHFKKWWWVHLIIFVIVVLVITLPLIYVGYPKIAQGDVNDSSINITSLALVDPTPNTVHAIQKQVLTNNAIYHPQILAFNASIMLVGGMAPIATGLVPSVIATNGVVVNIDDVLQITNESAMTEFSIAVLTRERFSLNFYGTPNLKEGPLPMTTVVFNKTVDMAGLNGLKGLEVTNPRVLTPTNASEPNMNGTINIPNPTVLTIALGNLTLDVSVNGTHIGQSFINDFTLQPGLNSVPMTAIVNEAYVLSLIIGANATYKDGILPLQITGNQSVYNGQVIPYTSKALASNVVMTNLNATEAIVSGGLGAILGNSTKS